MDKLYTVAGVAKNSKGQLKVRVSTLSLTDTKNRQIAANNTDIFYVELPKAMSRTDAWKFLASVDGIKSNQAYAAAVAKKLGIVTKGSMGVKMPAKPAKVAVDAKIKELAVA